MAIPVLYEDEHLLIVDKPARMLVVSAPGRSGATVVDQLHKQTGSRVYAVHRLDEDTTGVLAMARSPAAKERLEAIFRAHEADRIYLAVVRRAPSPPAGRIESRLRENARGIVESATSGPGEKAVTHYRTVRRLKRETLVECRLETGRRNQIRLHCQLAGYPIVGERQYIDWGGDGPKLRAPRQSLHAHRLAMVHPTTGLTIRFESPLPSDLAKLAQKLRRRPPARRRAH